MKIEKFSRYSLLFCGLALFSACGHTPNNPNGGFFLLPQRLEVSATTGSEIVVPTTMRAQGQFIEPQGTIQGTVESFPAIDIGPAATQIANAKVPAKWRITYVEVNQIGRIPCQDGIQTVERNVSPSEVEPLLCRARVFPISVSPNAIDAQLPPPKIDFEVEGISDEYGPPQIAIFDEFGQLRAAIPATVVSLGKGKIQIDTPNLSQYYSGVYSVTVSNIRANGAWDVIGGTEVSIYGNAPPIDPHDPNPCAIPAPCLF